MNRLFYGDNLEVLRKYVRDESVDLVYIDPPFNSKQVFNMIYNNVGKEDKAQSQAFIDTWTWDDMANLGLEEIRSNYNGVFTKQSIELMIGLEKVLGRGTLLAYLVSMTLRIAEIHRILKVTGSFYLHCDPTASHYLKLVCDAIFCGRGGDFLNEISWRRHYSHNDGNKFGCIHDIVFYYSKSSNYTYNRQFSEYDGDYITKNYASVDEKTGKRFRSVSMNAAGRGDAKWFGDKLLTPPPGTHWRWSQERINEALEEGIIYFTSNEVPRYKQFLEDMEGVPVQDTWTDFYSLSSHDKERLGYPTQKPEVLLERIIQASSNEGDVVLDCYCGCGTSVAVAQRFGRQWIGVDITYQSISLILRRLEDSFGKEVLEGIELSGLPKDLEGAVALCHKKDDRLRKEFEKWIILTYTKNRASVNDKKGGDGGIDGMAFVLDKDEKGKEVSKSVIFSVKSNDKLTPAVVRELNGAVEREGAVRGVLLTLYRFENLVKDSKQYGLYRNGYLQRDFEKIEVICVEDVMEGLVFDMPTSLEVLKKATGKVKGKQGDLLGE